MEIIPLDVLVLRARKYLANHVPRLEKERKNLSDRVPEILGMVTNDPKESLEATKEAIAERLDSIDQELRACRYRNESLVNLHEQIADERCCICFDEFDEFALPGCSHPLCKACCSRLLTGSQRCPICRQRLKDIQYTSVKDKSHDPLLKRRNTLGSKTEYLLRLLDSILEKPESRVIVFSRWARMLKNIEESIKEHKLVKLAGNVHHMGAALRRFRLSRDVRVALLSADVCASGINLTEADHVVILDAFSEDPKLAEATENQAIGRAHRLGQKKPVTVIRLIMKDTVEERLVGDLYPPFRSI